MKLRGAFEEAGGRGKKNTTVEVVRINQIVTHENIGISGE